MSVWCPGLATDLLHRRGRRLRSPDPRPVLLTERRGQRRVVAHACERAQAAGVVPGMALADAMAVLPPGSVRVEAHASARDARALHALAVWAVRFAPSVGLDSPDGLLLDVTGCARVWRGEARLRETVVRGLAGVGLRAEVAIGPTFGTAWALARFGSGERRIAGNGEHRALLVGLPVAALRLGEAVVADLASLGIERVGHLLALPRHTLPARFGEDVLLRLDQAMGEAIETIDPVREVDPVRAERVFDGPTARWDAIEHTVRDLLAEVCAGLLGREQGALRVEVVLARSDLPPGHLAAVLSRPNRTVRHLWAILRPKLERAHLGFGVEGVTVTATRAGRITHEQAVRWQRQEPATAKAEGELLDALAARLGGARVVRAHWDESHVPERAAGWSAVMDGGGEAGSVVPAPGDRPTVLLERPIEARAMALTPDGPVLSLSWGGEDRRVVACVGPERIGPAWWEGDRDGRDYYRLQDDRGRWVWAYREIAGRRWFVHGVWA